MCAYCIVLIAVLARRCPGAFRYGANSCIAPLECEPGRIDSFIVRCSSDCAGAVCGTGILLIFLHVVHGDGSIGEAGGQHVRMLRVDVNAHDPAVGRAKILGERRVLEGEDAHVAGDALVL